jgi:hypothetical protein
MFERREQIRRWFNEIVEKFRQKGATSPDKAMTPQELDLPPRFEEAMKRRLGRSGVFVEVDGKYYLSEERLKQIEQMRSARGDEWNPRKRIMTLRLIQLGIIVLLITLLLVNFLIESWELRIVTAAILVAWLLITLLQFYYLSRARKRFARTYCLGLASSVDKDRSLWKTMMPAICARVQSQSSPPSSTPTPSVQSFHAHCFWSF